MVHAINSVGTIWRCNMPLIAPYLVATMEFTLLLFLINIVAGVCISYVRRASPILVTLIMVARVRDTWIDCGLRE